MKIGEIIESQGYLFVVVYDNSDKCIRCDAFDAVDYRCIRNFTKIEVDCSNDNIIFKEIGEY